MKNPEIQQAFAEYDRRDSIHNSKVGCLLAIVLMPLGSFSMDYFMYRQHLWDFFLLRLGSSVLTMVVLALLMSRQAEKHYRALRRAWYWIPMTFIACLIAAAKDPSSPYYAGFNLVLLTVGVVLPWTYRDILATSVLIIAGYVGISLYSGWGRNPYLANNLFFLGCTALIVVTGSYFHSRLRFREFSLRFELERNRKIIEENNRKLVELDAVKNRFFANISHELRTPLTLLLAPLEALMRRFNLDPESRSLLTTMHSNGMRLLKLINDLLDVVRLESGRMEVKSEPVELNELIKGLASATRQVAESKRLRLETVVDPNLGVISVDRDKLEKVLLNLVFNALKFTPAGGRVEIKAQKVESEVVLTVADTGMGISASNLPYVFDRFWQADGSSKRKFQGVGIGLSLVKELVEIQGGEVRVESIEGRGTTFTVRLPYQPGELPASAGVEPASIPGELDGMVTSEEWLANLYRRAELFPAVAPIQELAPGTSETHRNGTLPSLLIADDEPDMLSFLKSQLSKEYRVIEAINGQQAVEKASQFLPDVILLDMMMPEKDGLQACREIREHTSTQSIPVILLTARADEETKLSALSVGASDFLAKPFSTTELHVRIRNLVESHEYQRKLSKQNQVLETTIEQLKDTETQLVQSEKLASLGRMSAGIIHEINNPLNFATTGLFTLRAKTKHLSPEQQETYKEILQDVEDGISRVKNIVSDLRMFTHPDTVSRDQVDLSEVISSALRFLSNEWKGRVKLHQNVPEHLSIWANKNKLIHVIVNLLQNSLDAVKAKTYEHEEPAIWIEGRVEGGKTLVAVRDNGMGIDAEHVGKIFDPFFTTKDVGQGMGLGLAICYRIVHEYEGRISVRTEPGKFCEFTLEFPVKG